MITNKNGYVYLLLEVDAQGNERHKIGITKNNVEKRIRQLQTGNSNIIQLLNMYESINYKRVEQILHARFSNCKTEANNEWFNLSNEDILNFLTLCKKADETIDLLKDNPFF